jgi:hypothetical protein
MMSDEKRQAFLALATIYVSIPECARRAGVTPSVAREWLEDKEFKRQYEDAADTGRARIFGLMVDAALAQGDFENIKMASQLRAIERLAPMLNPDMTGKIQQAPQQFIFQSVIPRNQFRQFPDILADVKELPDADDDPLSERGDSVGDDEP